jgi:cell division protein FtsB
MSATAKKLVLRKAGLPLLLAFAFFYLGFHALSGERGLVAWFTESKKLQSLKEELAITIAKREEFERKVRLLSSTSLDLDMLDEQARAVLGFGAADEMVIMLPEN